jgi:hypothetical protein
MRLAFLCGARRAWFCDQEPSRGLSARAASENTLGDAAKQVNRPGTSKWNKIEHRLFRHITQNRRGRPLACRSAVVELIAATTTKKGMTVHCERDANTYEKGVKVSDAEMAALTIEGDAVHPE